MDSRSWLKAVGRAVLPRRARELLRSRARRRRAEKLSDEAKVQLVGPPEPVSRSFGLDRGLPLDRYYIERFMERFSGPRSPLGRGVQGHVLEVAELLYVRGPKAFEAREAGGPVPPFLPGVVRADVVDLSPKNTQATIVADLASESEELPSEAFDCVICTQTLQFVFDLRAAVRTLHRILRPGGVVLATVPGISQICPPELAMSHTLTVSDYPEGIASPTDRWRVTTNGARSLFEEAFHPSDIVVESYGNLTAAVGFLQGLAAEDFQRSELDRRDPAYQLLIGICAVRQEQPGS